MSELVRKGQRSRYREGPLWVESGDIKLDRLSARGLAQAVQSLLEDRSDFIPQIVERRLLAERPDSSCRVYTSALWSAGVMDNRSMAGWLVRLSAFRLVGLGLLQRRTRRLRLSYAWGWLGDFGRLINRRTRYLRLAHVWSWLGDFGRLFHRWRCLCFRFGLERLLCRNDSGFGRGWGHRRVGCVGLDDVGTCQRAGAGRRRNRGFSVIRRRKGSGVHTRCARMLGLEICRFLMRLLRRGFFFRRRRRNRSVLASIEAGVIGGHVVGDDLFIIDVCDVRAADVVDGAIVEERTVIPAAALITGAAITKAVRNSAVKTDVRTPIALVEYIEAVYKPPISGRPEQARMRRRNPGTRHPVVIQIVPSPIPRRPHVTGRGKRRLIVVW